MASASGRNNRSDLVIALVVEDEAFLRWELAECLRSAGWIVVEATSKDQALKSLVGGAFIDVLITDIHLDGPGSGWDIAEIFRAISNNIPVVYTSGNRADRTRAVSNSVFFNKPYRSEEVLQACQQLISTSE